MQTEHHNGGGSRGLLRMAIATLAASCGWAQAAVTYNWTGAGAYWNQPSAWNPSAVPNAAGDLVQSAAGNTYLDINATIGQVRNTAGSGSQWTILATAGKALTLDNTNGVANPFNTNNASISYSSSGPISIDPNLILKNTDLDVGSINTGVNYVRPMTLGVLGTSTLTAATPQTLNLRVNTNYAVPAPPGGHNVVMINADVGGSGSPISIANVGTGSDAAFIAGRLLSAVAGVTQNSPTSMLVLQSGNNTYSGPTLINAGTLSATSDGGLGSSAITVNAGGQLTLGGGTLNNYINDASSLALVGSALANLNYTGTDMIQSLIVNGVALPAGTYGSLSSGAANTLPVFTGTGTLTVTNAAVPEPTIGALALAGGALLCRRRHHG